MTAPEIDVLVCSYNEADYIPALLESLRQQTVGPERFRVIFVDNASTDHTRQVIEEHCHTLNLDYLHEPRLGKNWACNTGYQQAKTEYVAHIDADAKADCHWLENIFRVIAEERPDLLGGPYYPYYITPKPPWFRYNSNYQGDVPRYLKREHLPGSNMVWRRQVVEQVKGFKTGVGVAGRGLARGDETELIERARIEIPGLTVFYDPDIVVYHLTRPQLFSMSYIIRRAFAQGCHDHLVWKDRELYSWRRLLLQTVKSITDFVRSAAYGLLLRDRQEFPYWQNYIYERLIADIKNLGNLYQQYLIRLGRSENIKAR